MLPFPFHSVPLEVLLPVQYRCPFHPEAWALCERQILLLAGQWHLSLFSLQILRSAPAAGGFVCSDALLLDERHAMKSKLKTVSM